MTASRLLMFVGVTVVYAFWLNEVVPHYKPVYLLCLQAAVVLLCLFFPRLRLQHRVWWSRLLIGAAIGYVASVVAALMIPSNLYGLGRFNLHPAMALFLYPAISFGWLYGLLAAAILFPKAPSTKAAILCLVGVLLIGGVAMVTSAVEEANRNIDLCWDSSSPDYIQDEETRKAMCRDYSSSRPASTP